MGGWIGLCPRMRGLLSGLTLALYLSLAAISLRDCQKSCVLRRIAALQLCPTLEIFGELKIRFDRHGIHPGACRRGNTATYPKRLHATCQVSCAVTDHWSNLRTTCRWRLAAHHLGVPQNRLERPRSGTVICAGMNSVCAHPRTDRPGPGQPNPGASNVRKHQIRPSAETFHSR